MKKICIIMALMMCAALMFGCVPEAPAQPATEAAETPAQQAGSGEVPPAQPAETGIAAALMDVLNTEPRELAAWTEFTGSATIRDGENEVPVAVSTTGEDGCIVSVDEHSDDLEYFYNAKSYIGDVDAGDGYTELIVTGDMGSDDYVTYIYRMENGEYKQASIDGCALGLYGDGTLLVDGSVDVLGTYGAQYQYAAAAPGVLNFERSSDFVRVMGDEDWEYLSLTVKKDGLPVRSIGTAGSQELALPAGTKLLMVMTDGESEAVLMDEAGNYYLAAVERNEAEWGWLIGGVSETEWFDYVPYSG